MGGAEIPAIGGTGNARAIAVIHTIMANGGVAKGKRFLSEAGCRRALEVQVSGRDRILGFPICNGLGFAVSGGVGGLSLDRSRWIACYKWFSFR